MPAFHLKRKASPVVAEHPALLVEQLSVGYPGHRYAIRDLSFSVGPGERVAVIGPNGAGKSTLFGAIVGTLQFTAGHISIHGADCRSSHSYVGYVPQQNAIDWSFPVSVFDVVMMGRNRHIGWFRLPGRDDHAIVHDILRRLSLDGLAKRQISELSGGQRRRVFIARALAQDARIMVLDEPFSGIDQHAEREVAESLEILSNHGITILLSTHHLEYAALHFDKVLLLNSEILAYGSPADVLKKGELTRAFGGALPVFAIDDDLLMLSEDEKRGGRHGNH